MTTDKILRFIQNVGLGVGLGVLAVGVVLLLNGCQMARGPGGEIIVGVPVGTLVETTEQALYTSVGLIPGVGGLIQQFLAPAMAGGFTVAGAAKAGRMALEKKRKASDRAREELRVEVEKLKTKLEEKEANA